ncbi:hypothetical protein BSZ39_12625 [Bowdeniella nasicola]|uniref:Sugar-binding domain-containing protein n=1 Tax=Bowdeniella nasicola TaxID=208480 RepID=A0A1Q5PXM8_9ACTO|nr:sugar-binding domain-containing protein [Bowdeniella nasicola]OKL52246.1 hypothetical protein BSZ39_12625 [Bowdeniella nasicola]
MFKSKTRSEREHIMLLLTVAKLYWVENKPQSEIAAAVGYSRPSISRLLAEARERNMVQIRVGHPLERVMTLETELAERFTLDCVRVAVPDYATQGREVIGRLAADLVVERLKSDSVISISNGRAVAATVEAMPQLRLPHARVVQMIGSVGATDVVVDSPETCRNMATKLGARYSALPVPLVVPTAEAASVLMKEEQVATTLELATRADIALVGVGSVHDGHSGAILAAYEDEETARLLRRKNVVGHICAHHFARDGRHVPTPFCQRTLAVDLERIERIPLVIGVAWGQDKVAALQGALAGGYLSALVTDHQTAMTLLTT